MVLGDERVGARGERELEELLVVGIGAARQLFAFIWRCRRIHVLCDAAAFGQAGSLLGCIQRVAREVIGEHALEFGLAGGVDENADLLF